MQLHRIKSGLDVFISICIMVTLTAGSAMGSFSDAEVSDNSNSAWFKRRWDMRRLGRGLNMLRLGKRDSMSTLLHLGGSSSSDGEDDTTSPGSVPFRVSNQLVAVLKDLMEQQTSRDETRRQPPLPRYGRRSVGLNRRTLSSESSDRIFPFDFSAEDDPVYRPPPRGGRYKREATGFRSAQHTIEELPPIYFPGLIADGDAHQRSVALPRIGRYVQGKQHDRVTKAVPHPRIGRDQLPESASGSSKQTRSNSDPMADPRGL